MKNNTKAPRDNSPKRKDKKEKKEQEKKDGPKRAKTSYMLFQDEHRKKFAEEVKAKNPDATPKDLFKLTALAVAEAWKNLSADDKRPYEEKSAAEKERLASEHGEAGSEKSSGKTAKGSKSVKEEKKKRPRTAYVLFSMEQRGAIVEKNAGADFGTIGKLVAEAWKSLPEAEKQTFKKRAADERSQFDLTNAETAEE